MIEDGEIQMRPVEAGDRAFLLSLYVERRSSELQDVAWAEADRILFLEMQFDLRKKAYEMRYPNSDHRIINCEHDIGEVIIFRSASSFVLVDICIAKATRGRGVATAVIKRLMSEALGHTGEIDLHVDRSEARTRELYERLGFVVVDDSDRVSIGMRWKGRDLGN